MPKEICSQCGFDHEAVRVECLASPFAVARILCGFKDVTERFHKKVIDWVVYQMTHGDRRMAVFLARGHLKSSCLTIAVPIWYILRDKNIRILLMQGSIKKAAENLGIIRAVLESSRVRHWFPEVVPGQPWNDKEIQVERDKMLPDPTVSARSPESKTTGGHFDVHIVDDLVGEDNFSSDAEMERCLQWFKNSTPLFVNPAEGVRVVIGTRWPNDRVYQYIFEKGSHEIFNCGIYVDKRCDGWNFGNPGDPVWPERFSHDAIAVLRRDIDDFEWSHQYLNVPVSDEVRRFKERDILNWDWVDPKNGVIKYQEFGEEKTKLIRTSSMYRVMTVDPAASGDSSADESPHFSRAGRLGWPGHS